MFAHGVATHLCSMWLQAAFPRATAGVAATTQLLHSIWLVHLNLPQLSCRSRRMLAHSSRRRRRKFTFSYRDNHPGPSNCSLTCDCIWLQIERLGQAHVLKCSLCMHMLKSKAAEKCQCSFISYVRLRFLCFPRKQH